VRGGTHYPFVIPLIQEIVGPEVQVIDPAPAVARQAQRLLEGRGWLAGCDGPASAQFFTSGDPAHMQGMLPTFLGETHEVKNVVWESGILH